jgi:hypothetical protein
MFTSVGHRASQEPAQVNLRGDQQANSGKGALGLIIGLLQAPGLVDLRSGSDPVCKALEVTRSRRTTRFWGLYGHHTQDHYNNRHGTKSTGLKPCGLRHSDPWRYREPLVLANGLTRMEVPAVTPLVALGFAVPAAMLLGLVAVLLTCIDIVRRTGKTDGLGDLAKVLLAFFAWLSAVLIRKRES